MRLLRGLIKMFKKNRAEQMNYLELHNQKASRVAKQKAHRKAAIQATYKLVRNVLVAGSVIGIGVYFFVIWYFREIPLKEIHEFDDAQIVALVAEVTRPLTIDDVGFQMDSEYALLINISNGRVLFEHQADVPTFPASVTKIMTVLIGLESGALTDPVIVRADFNELFIAGALQSGFTYGEQRTLAEILHAIMLPSGAEATWALANHVAGDYESFVGLMNEKAQQLGMAQTHFVTATGLHDDDHYTTAHDIAILLRYALENPDFKSIFTARSYELETPNTLGSFLNSTLFMFAPTTVFEGGEIIGGRTGFTSQAGRCLASLATDGNDEFILITFGAADDGTNPTGHILDALLIYEYFLEVEEDGL